MSPSSRTVFRKTPAGHRVASASGRQIRHAAYVSPIADRPNTTIFAEQKGGAFSQIDIDPSKNPRTVEQDGFLRQPAEMRTGFGSQRNVELRGGPLRAIHLFGSRRRLTSAAILRGAVMSIFKAVAADDPAPPC